MLVGKESSARLRWLVVGALLGAALIAPAAHGAPAAGGAQASLDVPVPMSASIEANNTLRVCFNLPVGAVVNPGRIRVAGYDVNRVAPASSATISSTSGNCVVAQFANGANDAPLTDFTRASVDGGAINGTAGSPNVGGGLALEGTAQTPQPGFSAGPDLVGTPTVSPVQGGNVTITYTFDQALDATPTVVPPNVFNSPTNPTNAFGYYGADGTVVSCGALSATASPGVSISGDTVTCRIPAATATATPPSRFFVLSKAVRDRPTVFSCCDVNPTGSAGGLTTRPVIQSVSQTGPTQATVTYNQPVAIRDAGQSSSTPQTAPRSRRPRALSRRGTPTRWCWTSRPSSPTLPTRWSVWPIRGRRVPMEGRCRAVRSLRRRARPPTPRFARRRSRPAASTVRTSRR